MSVGRVVVSAGRVVVLVVKVVVLVGCVVMCLDIVQGAAHYRGRREDGGKLLSRQTLRCASRCAKNASCKAFNPEQCDEYTEPDSCNHSACYVKKVPCALSLWKDDDPRVRRVHVLFQEDKPNNNLVNAFVVSHGYDMHDVATELTMMPYASNVFSEFRSTLGKMVADVMVHRNSTPPEKFYIDLLYEDGTVDVQYVTPSGDETYYRTMIWESPKPLREVYGPTAPTRITAADMDRDAKKLYLISANLVYEYDVSTIETGIEYEYSFVRKYSFSWNDARNPFHAGLGSELSSPPPEPHALMFYQDTVFVLSGDSLFTYNRTSTNWKKEGPLYCKV